jgi:hypothetical protein
MLKRRLRAHGCGSRAARGAPPGVLGDRRAFLKKASTTAALLAGAPLLTASRAGGADERLVIAVGQWGIETPFAWRSSQSEKTLWDCMYDPLIMRDPKTFEYRPGLATEWKPSNEMRTWTFKLRAGVMFHEGFGEMTDHRIHGVDVVVLTEEVRANFPLFIEVPRRDVRIVHAGSRVQSPAFEETARRLRDRSRGGSTDGQFLRDASDGRLPRGTDRIAARRLRFAENDHTPDRTAPDT